MDERQNQPQTPSPAVGLDGRAYAIGILSVTACILFVGLLLTTLQPAQASSQSDRAGDYKMLTQRVTNNKEALIVVDAAAKKALVYDFDYSTKQLLIANYIPLDQLPKPRPDGDGQGQPQPPSGSRRRP